VRTNTVRPHYLRLKEDLPFYSSAPPLSQDSRNARSTVKPPYAPRMGLNSPILTSISERGRIKKTWRCHNPSLTRADHSHDSLLFKYSTITRCPCWLVAIITTPLVVPQGDIRTRVVIHGYLAGKPYDCVLLSSRSARHH
jgi:hypothetical protein